MTGDWGANRVPPSTQRLRRVTRWLPDVSSQALAAEAHRQSALVAATDDTNDDMAFIEAVSDDWSE